ncbi:MAG: TRAP transporter permease, partial [Firmicutes bacterium]|nr:TRAP transporter permease [Bacillota bacterium]
VVWAAYHLWTAWRGTPAALVHRSTHLAFMFAIVFIVYPMSYKTRPSSWLRGVDLLLACLGVYATTYIINNYHSIVMRAGMPNTKDLIVALIIVVLVIEASRRVTGWVLPVLAAMFLAYGLFGYLVPGRMSHRGFDVPEVLEYMALTTEGIFGTPIGVSAQYLILFILFGAFLLKSGVGDFFNDLAIAIAGRARGGPAQVAVVASGFMGSINGSAVANVVTTGTFTIPLMKKIGYSPEFAGGVEAAASSGGQILPPVMGAAAFIMAETLGVPYVRIMYAAIVPALLYYIAALTMVYFRASRRRLRGLEESEVPKLGPLLRSRAYLFLPLVALVYFLVSGYTPTYAAFVGIIASVVVSWFRRETRMTPKRILEAMDAGARSTLSVAVACAVVGIVVGISTLTGLGTKLAGSIISWSMGNLFLTLFFVMIACIFLGLGMPSIPAYILTATMAAPALARLGVAPLVSHFFVFYFAMLANVTPPVALAAFAAAGISGGNIAKTGYEGFKLASAGFLVPYMFVMSPVLLGQNATFSELLHVTVTALVGVVALAGAIEGWFFGGLSWLRRLALGAAALLLIRPGLLTDMAGAALIGLVWLSKGRAVRAGSHREDGVPGGR